MNRNRSRQDMRPMFIPRWELVPHYYGDAVRMAFIAAAALMLISAPFYSNSIRLEMPFIILGGVVAVVLAALTSPYGRAVMTANVVVAGAGMVLYGGWGLFEYQTIEPFVFVLREGVAFIFLLALYFSLKTLRAMYTGLIGKEPTPYDFDENYDMDNARSEDEVQEVHFTESGEENPAMSKPEDEALDGLGNPAAVDNDKGD